MDFKVSRKEKRWQPRGQIEVLVDNVFDLYPVFGNPANPLLEDYIMDVEMLDSPKTELLDRAMFSVVKQRGADPTALTDGVQWAESILGEVPSALILLQVQEAVEQEGPGVQVGITPSDTGVDFTISLTNGA